MAKKKSKKQRKPTRATREPVPSSVEDKRSVALTVAWMMCTLATIAAILLYAIARIMVVPPDAADPNPLAMVPGIALFSAVITGSLSLGSVPLVYRVRQSKPPIQVTIASILIALVPWLIVLVNRFR